MKLLSDDKHGIRDAPLQFMNLLIFKLTDVLKAPSEKTRRMRLLKLYDELQDAMTNLKKVLLKERS